MADAHSIGPVPADERFEITMVVRGRAAPELHAMQGSLSQRRYLSREEYAAMHGASDDDLDAVAAFARKAGMAVVERRPAARSIVLSCTAAQVSSAFQTAIERVEHAAGMSRRRTAPVQLPPELAGIVEGVFGIEDTPIARPYYRFWPPPSPRPT
jgi:kumamolisin